MSTKPNAAPTSHPTLRRSFADIDLMALISIANAFVIGASLAKNSIITRVAGMLLDQVAGKIGTREFTDFQINFRDERTIDLELAMKRLILVGFTLKDNPAALPFLTALGSAVQAEYLHRRNIPVPIDRELGHQPN